MWAFYCGRQTPSKARGSPSLQVGAQSTNACDLQPGDRSLRSTNSNLPANLPGEMSQPDRPKHEDKPREILRLGSHFSSSPILAINHPFPRLFENTCQIHRSKDLRSASKWETPSQTQTKIYHGQNCKLRGWFSKYKSLPSGQGFPFSPRGPLEPPILIWVCINIRIGPHKSQMDVCSPFGVPKLKGTFPPQNRGISEGSNSAKSVRCLAKSLRPPAPPWASSRSFERRRIPADPERPAWPRGLRLHLLPALQQHQAQVAPADRPDLAAGPLRGGEWGVGWGRGKEWGGEGWAMKKKHKGGWPQANLWFRRP